MTVTVAGVWAPRFMDSETSSATGSQKEYEELFQIQRQSARKYGCRHVIFTDAPVPRCENIEVKLDQYFSRAILDAQLAAIQHWDDAEPLVLVDADVLINRPLDEVFDGSFDIGITNRNVNYDPINNGVMYFAPGARAAATLLFNAARASCGRKWGEDQQSVARVIAPVPLVVNRVEKRKFADVTARVFFMNIDRYNYTPGNDKVKHDSPYALHFKGGRKAMMRRYAERVEGLKWI